MERKLRLSQISSAFEVNPVVALLGPRQCGKTTLARTFSEGQKGVLFLDLEDPRDLARLDAPMLALDNDIPLVVIDEIQRRPELFPVLRVLIDKSHRKRKFLILGSASRDLIQQSSETLAGRISHIELSPFSLFEAPNMEALWVRGGFPLSFLADSESASLSWRESYISTFLERDIPALGFRVPATQLRRFWMMLAHYHGSIFNASEIGNSLGVSHTAVNNYLGILTGTFMVRQLQPWHANISKRQVKSPKIYFRDSGIWHALMNISDTQVLNRHPKLGASWEGFALEQVIRASQAPSEQCFFWGIHAQAELDLLIFKDGKKIGFEVKFSDAPTLTKSMRTSIETLSLDQLNVIYPGAHDYPLADKIQARSLANYCQNAVED